MSAATGASAKGGSSSSLAAVLGLAIGGVGLAAAGAVAWVLAVRRRRSIGPRAGAAATGLSDGELAQLAETLTGLMTRVNALAKPLQRAELPAGGATSPRPDARSGGERGRTAS